MMNCQSEACARSSSRAACASTGRAAGAARPAGAASQNASSSRQSRSHVHAVWSFSHMLWSPFAPQEPSASCSAVPGAWASRCCDAVTARTPSVPEPRSARYVAARKSAPSNHQCPNSSVSNGATMMPSPPRVVPFRVEPLRAQRNLAVGPERAARARKMGVGEEVAKPRVRQVLLDATPHLFPTPLAARAIGALGQPATQRGDAEQAPVLLLAHRELQPNAFVPTEQRQVAVRGSRSDDLQAALLPQAAKGGDEISVDSPEQPAHAGGPA